MSKIGRRPIDLGSTSVEINGQEIAYKGKAKSGSYKLPEELKAIVSDGKITLSLNEAVKSQHTLRGASRVWGLHRALLFNEIAGSEKPFERKLEINGLGFKAVVAGSQITFTLGYSHKIDFTLPELVSIETDKTGQKLLLKSTDKELLGHVCSKIRALREPEPYKGTGIKYFEEVIVRKAGKTKS